MQKQQDDYKKECDKAKIEIAALESTNKSHQETIDAYQEQLEEADKAADMAVKEAADKILQEKIMALATQAVALAAKATLPPPPLPKSPTKIRFKAELGAEDHPFSAGDPTSVIHGKPLHVQGGGDKPLLGAHVDPPATQPMGTQTQKEPNPPPQLAKPMVSKGHAQCQTELEYQGATTAPGSVAHSKHVAATTLHHQNIQQPGTRPPTTAPAPPAAPHQRPVAANEQTPGRLNPRYPYPPPEETPQGDTIKRNLSTISKCAPSDQYTMSMPHPSRYYPPPVSRVTQPEPLNSHPIGKGAQV